MRTDQRVFMDEQPYTVPVMGIGKRDLVLLVQPRRFREKLRARIARPHHIDDAVMDVAQFSPPGQILVGRLAGAMVYGLAQTLFFTIVLFPFGLSIRSGFLGLTAMMIGGLFTALAVGALMSAMAIKTGSSEAVQGSFPLIFILLFFSSAFFPRQTMDGVYRRIADLNPLSYLVEGFRSLTIDQLTLTAVLQTILIPAAISVVGIGISLRTLHNRLAAS